MLNLFILCTPVGYVVGNYLRIMIFCIKVVWHYFSNDLRISLVTEQRLRGHKRKLVNALRIPCSVTWDFFAVRKLVPVGQHHDCFGSSTWGKLTNILNYLHFTFHSSFYFCCCTTFYFKSVFFFLLYFALLENCDSTPRLTRCDI